MSELTFKFRSLSQNKPDDRFPVVYYKPGLNKSVWTMRNTSDSDLGFPEPNNIVWAYFPQDEIKVAAKYTVFDLVDYSYGEYLKEYTDKYGMDPRDNTETWHEFLHEDLYSTYLKCNIWHTDGSAVELRSCYKECPYPKTLDNGNESTHWMVSEKYTEDNPPSLVDFHGLSGEVMTNKIPKFLTKLEFIKIRYPNIKDVKFDDPDEKYTGESLDELVSRHMKDSGWTLNGL